MLHRCLVWIIVLLGASATQPLAPSALADTPSPPPEVWTACSRSGEFCARLDPAKNVIDVYRAGAEDDILWSMPGWFRVAALADDGEHLVAGNNGINLVPQGYDADMVMLTFHRRGAVIATVPLNALIGWAALQLNRTASHHYWGNYIGFDEDGYYVVKTATDRRFRFDVTTGTVVR